MARPGPDRRATTYICIGTGKTLTTQRPRLRWLQVPGFNRQARYGSFGHRCLRRGGSFWHDSSGSASAAGAATCDQLFLTDNHLTFSVCQKSGIEYLWTALKLKAGVPGSFKLEFALLSKLFLY